MFPNTLMVRKNCNSLPMKYLLLLILPFSVGVLFAQRIDNPTYLKRDQASIQLDRIDLTSTNTILYLTYTSPSKYTNGGWVNIRPEIYLQDTYGSQQLKLIRAEGVPLAPNKHNFSYAGEKIYFKLFFPALPSSVYYVNLVECLNDTGCFNFYAINVNASSYEPAEQTTENSRSYIKQQIEKWGECKNVALTLTGGDVAIYGGNGYAANGIPQGMLDKLQLLNQSDQLIDDLVLTESGNWMILYGDNGINSYGAPDRLFNKLTEWNSQREVITSVTFNDNEDWIAITETKYSASSPFIIEKIQEGEAKHGEFWAAHLTNDGMVLCFERGYVFWGNVPENLKKELRETTINVFRIKFLSDGTFFIADFDGRFSYFM